MFFDHLIDDTGEMWAGNAPALRRAAPRSLQGPALHRFFILNLGFVGLNVTPAGSIITLRPSIANPATLAAVYRWLADLRPPRVVLSWYDRSWRNELRPGGDRVFEVAARLRNLTTRGTEPAPFQRREIEPSRLTPSLQAVLEHWTMGQAPDAVIEVCRRDPGIKYILLSATSSRSMRVAALADNMLVRAKSWRRIAIGQPFDSFVDTTYGEWINRCYARSLDEARPFVEAVCAKVRWSEDAIMEHTYERLILPFRERDGRYLVLGASLGSDATARIIHP